MGSFNKMSATNWKLRRSTISFYFHFTLLLLTFPVSARTWVATIGGQHQGRQPRLKRYWADTKVTMCSRQVWAVHSDRNWEMCSLDLPFWRKPGTSSMFWARRIHSLRGICIPPSLCAPKAEKVKMFVSTMEFETFYRWSLQIIE